MSTDTFTIADDLEVCRMGYGAMRLCGENVWGWPDDRAAATAVLERAVELGIDLIDTSDAYGPETNEYIIADSLAPYSDVVVATKGGLVRPEPEVWETDGRPRHLRAAINNSLRRLETDTIDLYQLHAVDDDVPLEESIGALKAARSQGKIRHIGVSNVTVDQLERALGIVDIVTVQNRYNLTDREHDPVVDFCTEHDIGFLPWYPLAVGDLSDDERLNDIANDHDATTAQIALAWLLHRSPVVLPIPGTTSIDHLEENYAALDIELSDSDMEQLDALSD